MSHALESYLGTYLGFHPRYLFDGIGFYEIKVVIDKNFLIITCAEDSGKETEEISLEDIQKMSVDEVRKQYQKYDFETYKHIDGFQIGDGGTILLFDQQNSEKYKLIIRFVGHIEELIEEEFTSTILFGPEQIKEGSFEDIVNKFEEKFGRDFFVRI